MFRAGSFIFHHVLLICQIIDGVRHLNWNCYLPKAADNTLGEENTNTSQPCRCRYHLHGLDSCSFSPGCQISCPLVIIFPPNEVLSARSSVVGWGGGRFRLLASRIQPLLCSSTPLVPLKAVQLRAETINPEEVLAEPPAPASIIMSCLG